MKKIVPAMALILSSALVTPHTASGQTFEVLGTRAAGMGGAFVGVADDASAVYWNPGGLASGSYFSLVLDYNGAKASPETPLGAGSQSATFLAIGMPAVGLTYYRLRSTSVTETDVPADRLDVPRNLDGRGVRVSSLITHHAGVTFVQSLTDQVSVGTTLKLVRGIAASGFVTPGPNDDLLDRAENVIGASGNQFDADIGIMARVGTLRAGLTVRNVREAEFSVPGEDPLRLDRQVRAGIALTIATDILLALDQDLVRVKGTTGNVRNLALGAEGRVTRRGFVRGGFRLNTLGDRAGGRAPVGTVGGTYAAMASVLVDGQFTFGGEEADRGWGVGARIVF
jgi:hypothetical protein